MILYQEVHQQQWEQVGEHKLIWHSLKKGMRVELYNRSEDVLNRVDISEDRPELVETLGQELVPFLTKDGIEFPPVSEWVARSRTPKRADTRWKKRMRRNGGTLPPKVVKAPSDDAPAAETDQTDETADPDKSKR